MPPLFAGSGDATLHHIIASCLRRLKPNSRLILIVLVTEELRCTFLFTHCHRPKLCTVNHCHIVAHIFPLLGVCLRGEKLSAQAGGLRIPAIDVARLQLQHLDWLKISASDRRVDWQPACKFDSVLKMQRASCYWLNAPILIIFPYVSHVDMKRSQAAASGEVITPDKASILDLRVPYFITLLSPTF